jgi:hypothetical protein
MEWVQSELYRSVEASQRNDLEECKMNDKEREMGATKNLNKSKVLKQLKTAQGELLLMQKEVDDIILELECLITYVLESVD